MRVIYVIKGYSRDYGEYPAVDHESVQYIFDRYDRAIAKYNQLAKENRENPIPLYHGDYKSWMTLEEHTINVDGKVVDETWFKKRKDLFVEVCGECWSVHAHTENGRVVYDPCPGRASIAPPPGYDRCGGCGQWPEECHCCEDCGREFCECHAIELSTPQLVADLNTGTVKHHSGCSCEECSG